eukprot:TRINITY_DN66198_c9_g2_i3.p1 TRINITY_DN66198_c9_g2~~TRINITY_DN66198_c9_g2_i3.p1  ORF type:complete len:551 (-),score=295.41 TRINITY_DN66198_c9_g2_i3:71-1723(-)
MHDSALSSPSSDDDAAVAFINPSNAPGSANQVQYFAPAAPQLSQIAVDHSVSLYSVADVVSRLFGVAPLTRKSSAGAEGLLRADVFHRPAANLMLSVNEVGRALVEKAGLRNIADVLTGRQLDAASMGASQVKRLKPLSYPRDMIAHLTSLATARAPSYHGVVSRSWVNEHGEQVRAFDGSAETDSLVSTLADLFTQAFDHEAMTVSFSADPQQASAFAAHDALKSKDKKWANFRVAYDAERNSFRIASPQGDQTTESASVLTLSRDDLLAKRFARPFSAALYSYDAAKKQFVLPNKVTLDATQDEVFRLFAEVEYALSLPSMLRHDMAAMVSDDVPDLFSVSFSTLSGIAARFGRDSQEFLAAARLIDAALPLVIKEFEKLYPRRLVAQLVVLGEAAPAVAPQTQVPQGLLTTVDQVLPHNQLRQSFPFVFVDAATRADTKVLAGLCRKLATLIVADHSTTGIEVYCPRVHFEQSALSDEVPISSFIELGATTAVQPADVQRYQIVLWLSILLGFVVLAAAYALAFMETDKDTLLYSKFNPNSDDRKRR